MSIRDSQHRGLVLLLATLFLLGSQGSPASAISPTGSLGESVTASVVAKRAKPLVVAPGRIGSLRMGSKTRTARKSGWIKKDGQCGWGAGRRAYRLDSHGNEVYKAYPDEVRGGRVLSMHAMGVVTELGVRTASLGEDQVPGSALGEVQAAYPGLTGLGSWHDDISDTDWPVYGMGDAENGWLDFYFDPATLTVNFVQVRTAAVAWGRPTFGC